MSSFIFKAFNSVRGPKPVGPYSTVVQVHNLLYLSGVIAIDNNTGKLVEGGIVPETTQVFEHIKTILEEAGSSLEKIATVKVYLDNIKDGALVNDIYQKYIKAPYPTRAMMEVSKLPMGAKIEIEVMAVVHEQCRL